MKKEEFDILTKKIRPKLLSIARKFTSGFFSAVPTIKSPLPQPISIRTSFWSEKRFFGFAVAKILPSENTAAEVQFSAISSISCEMKTTVLDMQNGVSEIDAYIAFGNRCGVPFVKKFISMLVQNLSKGNKELVEFLKTESATCWEEKKHLVRRQGEAAANKLMIPLGMILIGIFVMILVPIVSNMGI